MNKIRFINSFIFYFRISFKNNIILYFCIINNNNYKNFKKSSLFSISEENIKDIILKIMNIENILINKKTIYFYIL